MSNNPKPDIDFESVSGPNRASVIAASNCDVTYSELKALLVGNESTAASVLMSSSPVTGAAALRVLQDLPDWRAGVDKEVAQQALHPGASVRAAAYRALASRDRLLFPLAWLAYEAALDEDEQVRAVVRELKPVPR